MMGVATYGPICGTEFAVVLIKRRSFSQIHIYVKFIVSK
jgi:hypothetical protein